VEDCHDEWCLAVSRSTGLGGLAKGTPVLFGDGRARPVEQVRVGDRLMGPDSKMRTVASVKSGRSTLYRVEPVKGAPWVCNGRHVLTLVHSLTNAVIDIPLDQWTATHKTFKHNHKLFSVGVSNFQNSFTAAAARPIDPYFLGVWFGDGSRFLHNNESGLALNGVVISKPDPEILALCKEQARQWGLHVNICTSNGTRCPSYRLSADEAKRGEGARGNGRWKPNPLLRAMRNLLGTALNIPDAYLHASRLERLQFLAGLCDTDGELSDTTFVITQKREDWARAIWQLARSLGFYAGLKTRTAGYKKANGSFFKGTYWVVSISGDTNQIPTRIRHKKAPPRRQKKVATRTGIDVTTLGEGPWRGFTLEGSDGRFLLGDFIVTATAVVS
jgi:hypothetical protein